MITTVNNQTIYNFLKEKTQGFKINFDFESLQELKESLERALLVEEATKTTSKQRARFCLNYSKSRSMQRRPILQYTCQDQIENTQVFTDSFFMVFLKNNDILPIPDYKSINKDWVYPDLTRLYRSNQDITCSQYSIKLNINKILNYFKLKEALAIDIKQVSSFGYNLVLGLSKDNFKRFVMFMNYKESEEITLYFNKTSNHEILQPLYAVNKNGSSGLILPCRVADNEETINIKDLQ